MRPTNALYRVPGVVLVVVIIIAGCSSCSAGDGEALSVKTDNLLICLDLGDSAKWWSSTHATTCSGGEDELDPGFDPKFDGPGGQIVAQSPRDGLVLTIDRYLLAIVPDTATVVWSDPASVVFEEELGQPPEFRVVMIDASACTRNCVGELQVGDTKTPFTKDQFCSPSGGPFCTSQQP